MGSVDRRLAKLEKKQKVHLLTEDVDIGAMIESGAAGADDFFIVMVMKDPASPNRRTLC
jgi:hypothetical protein